MPDRIEVPSIFNGPAPTPRYRFHGGFKPARHSMLTPSARTPDNTGDVSEAVLRLYDPIDSWGGEWGVSATEFLAALDALDPGTEQIRLHLNSPGGEVFEAVAILNALRRHDARVVTVVDGIAASAASFIAAGADETVMAPNSQLMIHDAWGLSIGNAADMREVADRLDQLSDNIASIYAGKAGTPAKDWRAAMLAETWYGAQDAVDAGLADNVEGSDEADLNRFDLSIFSRTPVGESKTPDLEPEPADDTDRNRQRLYERKHRVAEQLLSA